jgi:type IV secretory pathway VirB10-like protein
MRVIIAGIAGVFASIIAVIAFMVMGGDTSDDLAEQTPDPEVIAERQAPASRSEPMTPVTETEGGRRSELHQRIALSEAEVRAGVMAPSVVTDVREASPDDEMAKEIFGNIFPETPEPTAPEPLPQEEPEPEPEPEPVVEEEEEVEQPEQEPAEIRIDPSMFRDRFRTDTARPSSSFGVRNLDPGLDRESRLGEDALRQLIGDDAMHLAGFRDEDKGWFEPYQVAGGLGDPVFSDPVVTPRYDTPVRPTYNFRAQSGYSAPLPEERSAARPPMTNVDNYGNAYTTSDQPNPYVSARSGPIVLARNGDIVVARLRYGFNSDDVRGLPVYAVISDYLPNGTEGPLNNARIQGQVAYSQRNAGIIFETLVLPNGREFDVSAIAVSLGSDGRTGIANRVNKHTLARYGSLFLSGIIQGIGEVAQIRLGDDGNDQPVVIINEGDGSVNLDSRRDEPSDGEIAAGALAPVGRQLSSAARSGFNRPPTISAPAGMPFGLVFVETVVSDPAQARTAFNPRTGQVEVVSAAESEDQPTVRIPPDGDARALTMPDGESFTPAGDGEADAVWQSLSANSEQRE